MGDQVRPADQCISRQPGLGCCTNSSDAGAIELSGSEVTYLAEGIETGKPLNEPGQ